jgi:hypothetical protein
LIERLFPEFNRHETVVVGSLTIEERRELARLLRKVQSQLQRIDGTN